MDKLCDNEYENKETTPKESMFRRLKLAFEREAEKKRGDRYALAADLLAFAVGFILSRCHLLFGARPLGLAFSAVLPVSVWSALGGVVIGSLTQGEVGIIFAAASVVIVFLRAILYDREHGEVIFGERLIVRMAVAVLGGFITAAYEWFVNGFSEVGLLFGISMTVLSPTLVFLLSGAFSSGITIDELFSGRDILSLKSTVDTERYNAIFFRASILAFMFFITLSLLKVEFFGISAAFIFSGAATLASAKRFGALHGLATGFVSALGISGVYAVSFGLLGLGAGVMFAFGTGYALIAGGALMSAWSIYYAGLSGFLTTFPEYLISAILSVPLLKKLAVCEKSEEAVGVGSSAEDMVGTMALAYRNKFSGSMDLIEGALLSAASAVRDYSPPTEICEDDYQNLVSEMAEDFCNDCTGQNLCKAQSIRPCVTNAEKIAKKLSHDQRVSAEDVNTDTEFCAVASIVAESINREAARLRQRMYKKECAEFGAESYELISKLIAEAQYRDESETAVDESITEMLTKVVKNAGIEDGVIRAFGERKRHLFLACEDEDGGKIASKQLRADIEDALGVKLSNPEFFRRGKMALMECGVRRAYSASIAFASRAGSESEISGDSAVCFESSNDRFYSLISDGMGKGKLAKETSGFVADYMKQALSFDADKETVLRLVNGVIRSREAECSATVDLFELDLITGDAEFIKSGAASSYVKRESSVFRIRSRTAPIGLLKSIDTEKIRVEIKAGDYIIMMSDGIVDSFDDAPWLLELLSRDVPRDVTEYAKIILDAATENATSGDDMSVTVIKVLEA